MQSESRWLSIGEFAAATQLSLKALRLYDEQRLLAPAKIDPANGYRLYRSDQVAMGRLIRTLRDMNVSLSDIGRFVRAPESSRALLNEFASSIDQRYAREKRAYQTALTLLHKVQPSRELPIVKRERTSLFVVTLSALTTRGRLFESIHDALGALGPQLARHSLPMPGQGFASIVDPLSDEEGRIEISLPIQSTVDLSTRRLPAITYASLALTNDFSDVGAAQDVVFDWFDRHGLRALDAPWLVFDVAPFRVIELNWAYEQERL